MRRARPSNARERLLDAAESVVARHGVATLTLDRVAAEAGTSKGGLLYHFPSKDALVEAMIARYVHGYARSVEEALRTEPAGPGRFGRALLRGAFGSSASPPERERRAAAALLAAVVNQPALLEPVRATYRRWLRELHRDGLPPGRATAVLAALDGLWLWNVFGLATLSPARTRAVRRALEDITRGPR